jgi:tetratricopeptide (TPR) repeat protein
LQEKLRRQPEDAASYSLLGAAYLQKARETGDPAYYKKAEQVLERALQLQPDDPETLITLGTLALARHDFDRALELGQQARGLNPYSARALGVMADAQIELGDYEAAVETVQAMVNLRPDMSSYARVAYVLELHGDVPGAAEAMQRAVLAGSALPENIAWTHTQLGLLQFQQGDLTEADTSFTSALQALPGYLPAQAGLARIDAARGDLESAIARYEEVVQAMPLAEYAIALGDCYRAVGDTAKAEKQYALVGVLNELQATNGVDVDLELVLFEADHPEWQARPGAALERARDVYARRPTIYAADALAWALYQAGEYAEAHQYAEEALRLNTQDALLWFHAGMIAARLGDAETARARLQQALTINPHFSVRWAPEAQATLRELGGPAR